MFTWLFDSFSDGTYVTTNVVIFKFPAIKFGIHLSQEELIYHHVEQKKEDILCSREFYDWILKALHKATQQKPMTPSEQLIMIIRSDIMHIPNRKGRVTLDQYKETITLKKEGELQKQKERNSAIGKGSHDSDSKVSGTLKPSQDTQSRNTLRSCNDIYSRTTLVPHIQQRNESQLVNYRPWPQLQHSQPRSQNIRGNYQLSADTYQHIDVRHKLDNNQSESTEGHNDIHLVNPEGNVPKKISESLTSPKQPPPLYERKFQNDTSNNIDRNEEDTLTANSNSAYPYIWKHSADEDPLKIITEFNKSLPDLNCEILSPLSGDENAQSDCVDKTEDSSSMDISKKDTENGKQYTETDTLNSVQNICENTGEHCSITKSNDNNENTSNTVQSKDMNDGIQDNINANLVKSPAQSNAYLDMPILDNNSLSMQPPETQSVMHSIPDMSSQLPNIGDMRNLSQQSVPVVTTQSESENINGIYSRRPFHLQDKTSFLFSQPYFPGYYSPSLFESSFESISPL